MPLQSIRSNEVFTYWDSLRSGRSAPVRACVDPAALRRRLPDLFMLDWAGPHLSFRLAGTRLCDIFGRELRGTRFSSLWCEACRDSMNEAALCALRLEDAVALEIDLVSDDARLPFEMLFLPLRSGSGVVDRLLGSLIPLSEYPTLGTSPAACLDLIGWHPLSLALPEKDFAPVDPVGRLQRLLPRALAGMARADWWR